MKTAVVYYSKHHGNTRKLLDAIAAKHELTLIDASETEHADLTGYDLVGFASGIYYSKFHKSVLRIAQNDLPKGQRVFFLYTCGAKKNSYTEAIAQAVAPAGADIAGEYGCQGYDTFGPFKLIGGIAKGHPTADELAGAVSFYESICG